MANIKNLVCNCPECKSDFKLESEKLIVREVSEINLGCVSKLFLKIIKCPVCNSEFVVQIDNKKTMELLGEQMVVNANIGVKKYSDKNTTKHEHRLKEISAKLIDLRKKLINIYNGCSYYHDGKEITINVEEPIIKIIEDNAEVN